MWGQPKAVKDPLFGCIVWSLKNVWFDFLKDELIEFYASLLDIYCIQTVTIILFSMLEQPRAVLNSFGKPKAVNDPLFGCIVWILRKCIV